MNQRNQQPPTTRTRARLKDPQVLRDAVEMSGLNIRELALVCGNPRYRSTIAALHSEGPSHRNFCSVHLANRLAKVLRISVHTLFALDVCSSEPATAAITRRRAA